MALEQCASTLADRNFGSRDGGYSERVIEILDAIDLAKDWSKTVPFSEREWKDVFEVLTDFVDVTAREDVVRWFVAVLLEPRTTTEVDENLVSEALTTIAAGRSLDV